jgi:branched-chain amino acid transport system ATP-binding protein
MSDLLSVVGLRAGYGGRSVLHGVDLHVGPSEIVALLGPNGAGKSTTLLAISGLIPTLSGEVRIGGAPRPRRPHRAARDGLAHVPEDRSLFPSLTVAEHLRLGSRSGGRTRDEVLDWFAPLRRLVDRQVGLLSGGEQQMVALARALMSSPRLLLIDEMSLGLAPIVVESLLGTLGDIVADTGCGVLLVEQHVAMALTIAQRAVVLSRGRVVVTGTAAELRADPTLLERAYLGEMTDTPA